MSIFKSSCIPLLIAASLLSLGGCAQDGVHSSTTPSAFTNQPLPTALPASPAVTSNQTPLPSSTTPPPAEALEPVQIPTTMSNGQFTSLWDVIRSGFTLNHYYNNPRVQYFVTEYTRNPTLIQNITTQAVPYMYTIVNKIEQRNLPTELALLPIVESGYSPDARSYCGALGLWQLMPAAAERFNAGSENQWFSGRENISGSTNAALDYLKYLYNYFNGDWLLALAAYNSGEGTVQNAVHHNEALGRPIDFWSLQLPPATEDYVPRLLALAIIVNDPSHYNIALPAIPNKPLVASTPIPQQMSLSQVAKFAGINESELKALNPGFTRSVTPPASLGQYKITLPVDKISTFEENCAANPGVTGLIKYAMATSNARNYGIYKVRPGDSLSTVSRFTGVSIKELKAYNHLRSNTLHAGETLRYPVDHTAAYGYMTYTVRKGDTIYSIAKKFGVNTFNLMQWNGLDAHSKLSIGQRLVIHQKIRY